MSTQTATIATTPLLFFCAIVAPECQPGCTREPDPEVVREQAPPPEQITALPPLPDHDPHVLIGPGSVIHAGAEFVEVAQLPRDASPLGLRIVDRRGDWVIVTPSRKSCVTTNVAFDRIELKFAITERSILTAAKEWISLDYTDGTKVEIAEGAPLRAVGAGRFELLVDGLALTLEFDRDPTTLYHRPSSVRTWQKPDPGFDWDWSKDAPILVGPATLHASAQSIVTSFELIDERERLVRLDRECAQIVARIESDGPLPPRSEHPVGSPQVGGDPLPPDSILVWPNGVPAGRVRDAIPATMLVPSRSPEGLRCFWFAPLELCVGTSP